MPNDRTALGPYRETALLRKWQGRPQKGEPDEVIERTWHYEADHTLVTCPRRIAEIDAFINGSTEQNTDALLALDEDIQHVRVDETARLKIA